MPGWLESLLNRLGVNPVKFREFIKFGLVGGSGVVVNMGLFYALTRWAGMRIEIASPVAIETSILTNFFLNNAWTFRRRQAAVPFRFRIVRYHLVTGLAGGVNYLVLLLLVHLAGLHDLVANLVGIVTAMFINYFLNSLWTWKE